MHAGNEYTYTADGKTVGKTKFTAGEVIDGTIRLKGIENADYVPANLQAPSDVQAAYDQTKQAQEANLAAFRDRGREG